MSAEKESKKCDGVCGEYCCVCNKHLEGLSHWFNGGDLYCDWECAMKKVRELEQRLSQAEYENKSKHGLCEDFSAENRRLRSHLTKAEAERDAYKKAKQENDERFMNERDEARSRLSHLMDIAGKMAGALEEIKGQCDELSECVVEASVWLIAKGAIAEWDGIKKDGGK